MQKYPSDAVLAAFNTVSNDEAFVERVLVEREGVSEKVTELAERAAVKLATNMLVALAGLRERAEKEPDPGAFYGEQAAAMTAALLGMMLLRGIYIGMLLERGEQAVEDTQASRANQHFTRDTLPPEAEFGVFAKVGSTRIARVQGPFSCVTIDGNLVKCRDGWLAVDGDGYPYPIADEIFRHSYALPTP